MAPAGMGHLLCELAKEKHEGTGHHLKRQNQRSGLALFQDVQKLRQDVWGETQDTTEATVVLEKNLTQALCVHWATGVCPHRFSAL